MEKEKLSSVADISKEVGISRQRVLQIIERGDLEAELVGSNYVVRQSAYDKWKNSRRQTGRPSKEKIS